eukprot:3488489-Alexandrium_andersonii.AAC.1
MRALHFGNVTRHMDISVAFLRAEEKDLVHVKPAPGLGIPDGYWMRLKKALYGRRTAGRNFR